MSILDDYEHAISKTETWVSKIAEYENALDEISTKIWQVFSNRDYVSNVYFHVTTYFFNPETEEWEIFSEWNNNITFRPHEDIIAIRDRLGIIFERSMRSDIKMIRIPKIISI